MSGFRKLTLGKFRGHLDGVEHIYVRAVTLKDGIHLSFLHRYPDRDLTQNYLISGWRIISARLVRQS